MHCYRVCIFVAALLLPLICIAQQITPTVTEQAVITVDPFTDYAVNGIESIQNINGLVVNGESRLEHVNETRELNASTLRLYLWVDVLGIKREDLENMKWSDVMAKWNSIDFDKAVPEFFDRVLSIDPKTGRRNVQNGYHAQFWQLEQLQAWNARKNIVLHFISPHPMTEADFPGFSRYFNACTREVKKRYPDLGPLYVMIFNEPDYEYPRKWETCSITQSVTFFNKFYNYVDAGMKKEFTDVSLIGPGISQFMTWAAWKNWTLPFLEQVPQAQLFNCQPYCWRFTDLLSWTQMLQAQSLKTNGRRLPLIATETNVDLEKPAADWWKDEYHQQRVAREAATLFGMMAHPDQFAFKHYFYYHYTCTSSDMWFRHDGVNGPAPTYWLYWLMRDVHGQRVLAAGNREESPIRVISSRNGQELNVCLFNESASAAAVKLQILWPDGMVEPSGVSEFLRYDSSAKKFIHGVDAQPRVGDRIMLAAGEVKKLRWVSSPTIAVKMKKVAEQEFYSPQTAITVESSNAQLPIKARKAGVDEIVKLRLAFYLDDILSIDRINWSVNGHEMQTRCSPDMSYGIVKPIVYVDCAIPNVWVGESNIIEIQAIQGTSFRTMFASLVMMPMPGYFPVYVRGDQLLRKQSPIDISVILPSAVEPGEITLSLKATNNTDSLVTGDLKLITPDGWIVKNFPGSLNIPAKSSSDIKASLTIPAGGLRGERFVTVMFTTKDQQSVSVRRGTTLYVPFQAEYAQKTPVINGLLDEWNPASFVVTEHRGPGILPYTSKLAARWDEKAIYLAMDVDGRKLDPVPAGQLPWHHDTFEAFFDFWNSKKSQRDHKCMQTWIVLNDMSVNKAVWSNSPNDPNGCFIQGTSPQTYQVKVVERENGFAMEAALDWQSLTSSAWLPGNERFSPKEGAIVGCEIALANRSLLGALVKNYTTPAKWGNLKLLARGERATMPGEMIHFDSSQNIQMSDAAGGAGVSLYKFDIANIKDWQFPSQALVDVAGLHLTNNHGVLLLEKSLGNYMSQNGIQATLTIGGFEKKGDITGKFRTHARIFLTPVKLGKFVEPYAMTDMICLVAEYVDGSDVSLQLYGKSSPGNGWGRMLWSATVGVDEFPMTLSMKINSSDYKIQCDKPLTTTNGSFAGHHKLPVDRWGGDVHFGITSCYGTQPGAVTIKSCEIH